MADLGLVERLAQLVEKEIGEGTAACGRALREALRTAQIDGVKVGAGVAARGGCMGCVEDIHDLAKRMERGSKEKA